MYKNFKSAKKKTSHSRGLPFVTLKFRSPAQFVQLLTFEITLNEKNDCAFFIGGSKRKDALLVRPLGPNFLNLMNFFRKVGTKQASLHIDCFS